MRSKGTVGQQGSTQNGECISARLSRALTLNAMETGETGSARGRENVSAYQGAKVT